MKRVLLVLVLVLALTISGCANFSRAQVGPDRFALYSRNADHTKLLENAYAECRMANHRDYIVLNTVAEPKGVTLVIQCTNSPRTQPPKEESNAANTTAPSPETPSVPKKADDAPSAVQKIYQSFKDTFK